MIKFLTALLAAIAATPIDPKTCEGKPDPRDGKALGTLPENLQRFWSLINSKVLAIMKVTEAHAAEHAKPGYRGEKCKGIHATIEKLDAERSVLSVIFWEAVRDEVAGAREVETIGVRKDFTVVEVKPDLRGSAEAALAELLGVGLR